MQVRDIMIRHPLSIEQDTLVGTAIELMVERKIRHLTVVDERGALAGVVTDRDLRSAALACHLEKYLSTAARCRLHGAGAALASLRVKDVMTLEPVTTAPDVPVGQAVALMLERQIGSLPVIERGGVAGIVTFRDAVRALATELPALRRAAELLW